MGVGLKLHSFLTSALEGEDWSTSRPGRFIPYEEPLYPLNRGLVGPQSWSGRFGIEKYIFPFPEFEPRVVQLTTLSRLPHY